MKIKERKKRRKKDEIKFREWNWNAWCFKVTTFPVFYFVKIRNGSAKLRSIFLVISVIQNRGEKKQKNENWENKHFHGEPKNPKQNGIKTKIKPKPIQQKNSI